jgi:cytochrome c oxidase subunit 4
MSDNHAVDIDKHVRVYMIVFASLAVLTVVTVGVYYLPLGPTASIALALVIATIKGALVACYFMHLISEKKFVYLLLIMTGIFFITLLVLPALTSISDQVKS